MKNLNQQNNDAGSSMRRRGFIKGLLWSSAALVCAPFTALAAKRGSVLGSHAEIQSGSRRNHRRVFIFQDAAHFDTTGKVDTYAPPRPMVSTRDYVNRTDEITFLKRHWFV